MATNSPAPKCTRTTSFIAWFNEKWTWKRYQFMSWYVTHLFRARCTSIGAGFRVAEFAAPPVIQGDGEIHFGSGVTIVGAVDLIVNNTRHPSCGIRIGDGTVIGRHCSIRAMKGVEIGANCLLAPYVRIYDHNGHPLSPSARLAAQPLPDQEIAPIHIGDNVWLGEFSQVQQGVTIGSGAIVGAHSVVTRSVPPNTVVFGVPARPVLWLDREGAIDPKADTKQPGSGH